MSQGIIEHKYTSFLFFLLSAIIYTDRIDIIFFILQNIFSH